MTVEVGTEAIRKKLKERKEFSASSAFLTLVAFRRSSRPHPTGPAPYDPTMAEHITSRDIKDLLERHGYQNHVEELDIHLLVDRFDKDGDGMVGLREVSKIS